MNTKHHVHQLREVQRMNPTALPLADSYKLYRTVYLNRLSVADQELVFQAAEELQRRIPGLGPGGSLELAAKLGWFNIEHGIPT